MFFPVASSILCTSTLTAAVVSVFSASGEVTRGKRNRLSDDNLERETLLSICFEVQSNSAMKISWSNFAIRNILYFGTTKLEL